MMQITQIPFYKSTIKKATKNKSKKRGFHFEIPFFLLWNISYITAKDIFSIRPSTLGTANLS